MHDVCPRVSMSVENPGASSETGNNESHFAANLVDRVSYWKGCGERMGVFVAPHRQADQSRDADAGAGAGVAAALQSW